jgi:hypothetical protein
MSVIYDKTNKGREEITTRGYHLASRLRSLLVIVDGKQTDAELLKKIAGLGLGEQHLQELLDQGFIAAIQIETSPILTDTPKPEIESTEVLSEQVSDASIDQIDTSAPPIKDPAEQFREVYSFFNDSIKSNIGFRGFNLQLKVERANNLQKLEELRRPFLEAIFKAKGEETLRTLSTQLDKLLGSTSADIVHDLVSK